MRYKYNSEELLHLYFSMMEKMDVWPSSPSPFWCKQTAHLQFLSHTYPSPGDGLFQAVIQLGPFDALVTDMHPVAPTLHQHFHQLEAALY